MSPDSLALIEAPGPAVTEAAVRQAVAELGLTYTRHRDAGGGDRPWPFDPIPLVLDALDWAPIEAGLAQRARLLDRLLQDFYGKLRVVEEGLLPPALVFDNPGFLRPCHGIRPPGDTWLVQFAADLVRLDDGGWAVLADRTQAPSGLGYTLANRALSALLAPQVLAARRIAPVEPAAAALAAALARLSSHPAPRGIVLTPGPFSETYAEHAFLARQLGFQLVRGDELSVAGGELRLDTLSGPQRVDLVLRRIDDAFADPLVLRVDSLLGAAGLVAAARAGTVGIANALGAGAVEAPGLIPYLPRLCEALLGETLKLPSVETLWLGEPAALARWQAAPQEWVLKSAFAGAEDPRFPGDPGIPGLLATAPGRYAAQRLVAPARLPVLGEAGPGRPIVLRGYAIAGEAETRQVLPGGLVRFGPAEGPPVVSMQQGGGAKDCWVVDRAPAANAPRQPGSGFRGDDGFLLPRRLADNLFWLGRYLERAAAEARRGSIPEAALASLARIARDLRGRLGEEAWRSLDRLFEASDPARLVRAAELAEAAIDRAAAALPDGAFVEAGRRIERGLQSGTEAVEQLRALTVLFAGVPGAPGWAEAARHHAEAALAHPQTAAPALAGLSDLLTRLCFSSPRRAA